MVIFQNWTKMINNMKILKLIRSIAFIVIAIIAFTFANKIDDMGNGDYVSSSRYGGDAYTGIQNAAAETGCNVYKGTQIVQKGFKYTFILAGLGFLAIGLTPILPTGNSVPKESAEIIADVEKKEDE